MTGERWSKEEDAKLRELYPRPEATLKIILEALQNRTLCAIHQRAMNLGVTCLDYRVRNKSIGWSKEEVVKLETLWDDRLTTLKDIGKQFPNRSANSIFHKTSRLHLKRQLNWAKESPLIKNKVLEYQIGFVAGMIEGEGSICMSRDKRGLRLRPLIRISNTKHELLEYCQNRLC